MNSKYKYIVTDNHQELKTGNHLNSLGITVLYDDPVWTLDYPSLEYRSIKNMFDEEEVLNFNERLNGFEARRYNGKFEKGGREINKSPQARLWLCIAAHKTSMAVAEIYDRYLSEQQAEKEAEQAAQKAVEAAHQAEEEAKQAAVDEAVLRRQKMLQKMKKQ